ncbi:MAG: hypothetical protein PHU43_03065 [Candidatus Bipolaricaulis sp.]|nr:hypothetical protein [Candidatus Bipolaricaulis sp.]
MRFRGEGAIQDVVGDRILYRNLIPVNRRLPGIDELREKLGILAGEHPRKGTERHARVVAEIVQAAARQAGTANDLARWVYVGDTRQSDGATFRGLCQVTGRPGWAFIAGECDEPGSEQRHADSRLVFAHSWAEIDAFFAAAGAAGFGCGSNTAVIVDLDKTLFGARGRNDHVVDGTRTAAALSVVCEAVGSTEPAGLANVYAEINHSRFRGFVEDNQDVVVYLSTLVVSGSVPLSDLEGRGSDQAGKGFRAFLEEVNRRRSSLSPGMRSFHDAVYGRALAGCPTLVPAFRRAEYRETVARMSGAAAGAPVDQLLQKRVVITGEVWDVLRAWQERGALVFALSDKPDEAAFPSAEAPVDARPIHATPTCIIGG